ncbi:MAG: polysaccharide deacetylase family protein [Deltaproteobacteria bacterium]|nr:polysaccharide deacetylase family protein [Deltaproteobacteria bacterium]
MKARALLSLHDVTPAFETEIRQGLSLVRQWRLPPPALMVAPDFHGRWSLDAHPAFCEFLRGLSSRGSEILLHGYDHLSPGGVRPDGLGERLKAQVLTSGEGEFQTLPFGRALDRITRGLDIVERTVGVRPKGFVAPAWLEHRDTYRALDAAGIAFHEDRLFVRDLSDMTRHLAPAVSFMSRSLARTYASVAWAGAVRRVVSRVGDLRFALHPSDFAAEPLVAAIGRLVDAAGESRDWVSYEQFLSA